MDVFLIQYKGSDYRGVNIQNAQANFARDSGAELVRVLDEPTKEDLVAFLTSQQFFNETILHFVAHGFEGQRGGIAQLRRGSTDIGVRSTLVGWVELATLFNNIAARCPRLYVNLGTVCKSAGIIGAQPRMNFDMLVTTTDVTDPVKARTINKQFVELSSGQRVDYINDSDYILVKGNLDI